MSCDFTASNSSVDKTLLKARPGDQIHFKGQFVNYKLMGGNGGYRSSSTTRDDYGCEVVYVTSAELLQQANVVWRMFYVFSQFVMIASGLYLFLRFLRLKDFLLELLQKKEGPPTL